MLESLQKRPDELLFIRTARQLRDLAIELEGAPTITTLTHEGAVYASNYATGWSRPLDPRSTNLEERGEIEVISAADCARLILSRIAEHRPQEGPISSIIRKIVDAGNTQQLVDLYRDAAELEIVPRIHLDRPLLRVTGFAYGGGAYFTDCFVQPHCEGSGAFYVTVVVCTFGAGFEYRSFGGMGGPVYEVYAPETVLNPA